MSVVDRSLELSTVSGGGLVGTGAFRCGAGWVFSGGGGSVGIGMLMVGAVIAPGQRAAQRQEQRFAAASGFGF